MQLRHLLTLAVVGGVEMCASFFVERIFRNLASSLVNGFGNLLLFRLSDSHWSAHPQFAGHRIDGLGRCVVQPVKFHGCLVCRGVRLHLHRWNWRPGQPRPLPRLCCWRRQGDSRSGPSAMSGDLRDVLGHVLGHHLMQTSAQPRHCLHHGLSNHWRSRCTPSPSLRAGQHHAAPQQQPEAQHELHLLVDKALHEEASLHPECGSLKRNRQVT
mmetsp:Transcript_56959/g.123301  ORF Transcript_56959/g.123301 Transcript_56959/m.123301 type:complete len:213 (-) Transcript_56959:53-691(-)